MHLLNIIGPPAAGKMTVGREVCRLTGGQYRLFHNHLTIEPLLGIFDFGTPPFDRLATLMRREVIREAVAADLPGLVFTYVWGFDHPADGELVRELIAPVVEAGQRVDFVELVAPLDVRIGREGTADRMDHKRSKRDVEWARTHLVEMEQTVRANTLPGEWPLPQFGHLRIDNAHQSPEATAEVIVRELGLPRG